ncbi:unnamed protein product [Adineta ricciae]|uniref:Helicase ARIP4-like n=1 Tax=Adineta ricciae TaxID=249248 RepID=A0A813TH54_ADIRI|nr:unnamed protein product [Adineta ricciae]
MVDSSLSNLLDEWFPNPNESMGVSDVNETPSSPLSSYSFSSTSSSPVLSFTEPQSIEKKDLSLPNNNEDNQKRKRKREHKKDSTEAKKSKQTPAYMRRNIRNLFTNDKLQGDTLSALKAEQDRLKRLEEINADHAHLLNNNVHPVTHSPNQQEYIVLDEGGGDDDDVDDNEQLYNSALLKSSDMNRSTADDDGNDSDVQCVDSDTEYVNDNVTKKLQRLHVYDRVNIPDEYGNILVNVNHPSDDPDLYITRHLSPVLKPHQIGGIRFMYDNIVESLQRFQATPGLGCILAHSMGCGKTLQVITFIDIFLRHTTAKSILVVVPINTIQNWANEFNRWCPIDDPNVGYTRPYQLYILNETSKKFVQRAKIVQNWAQTGGTLIIGYEMFRLLVTKKPMQMSTSMKTTNSMKTMNIPSPTASVFQDGEEEEKNFDTMEDVANALINPDLVICDEGHRIKNHLASVAIALKSIRTQRRIVLTGYPLQNNLIEYWCMVDFIRPNYLGSKQEFCNMFERPILNGQCVDSTSEDRQLMRARAHVLHSLLEGFIQRRGHDVLQTDLPPKTEYVILLKLSYNQRQLYMKFLEAVGALSNTTEKTLNPLRAFTICCKIWNHADVLYKFVRDRQDGADVDFDMDIEQNSNSTNRALTTKSRSNNRLNIINRSSPISSPQTTTMMSPFELQTLTERKDFDYDFANSILNSYTCGQLSNGIKFQVALTIIDFSVRLRDKILLFSQSLLTLNELEKFLNQQQIPNTDKKWEKNTSYYRLDGSTSGLERERLINAFNAPNSSAQLFLLSTRAGCLGINLTAANRVIVLDVSWNPCLDAQAICRVYRYGQRKHCYIYRLIADFTMEKRIYDRQIAKQGMSDRVVDELQPQNQFTRNEVEKLLHFAAEEEPAVPDLVNRVEEISDDPILLFISKQYAQSITKVPFTHESLLLDKKENQLTSAEKRRAQKHYQHEKQMNIYGNRSRFNASRASSYLNNSSRFLQEYQRLHRSPLPSFESRYPQYNNYQLPERKQEPPKQSGASVQVVTLRSPLQVQINSFEREHIPSGAKIQLIKSSRGSYVRTPDGRYFSIRQSPSTAMNSPQPTPKFPPLLRSPPRPPPPPQLPRPQPTPPSATSLLDELLSDSMPFPSSSIFSNDLNDLNDEIDLLLDDLNSSPTPASSSTLENRTPWQNDDFSALFSNPFDMFPSINSTTNNPTTNSTDAGENNNSFTTNPLTFF